MKSAAFLKEEIYHTCHDNITSLLLIHEYDASSEKGKL
jgi:hypothetical protein